MQPQTVTTEDSTDACPRRQNVDDLLMFVRAQANLKRTEKSRAPCKH
ncbi:MAG: hypothetical protein NWF00_02320 [Candidatus Bathyarchaeota archaeon]|nr:hypothetical protein [Candidatus Bathyarchaeota archaeon]